MPADLPGHAAPKAQVTAEHQRRAADLAQNWEQASGVAGLQELLAVAFAAGEQTGHAHGFPDGWEAGVRLALAALDRLPAAERGRADAAIRAFADRADVVGQVWSDTTSVQHPTAGS